MNGRPPQLNPRRLLGGLLVPLALYTVLRLLTGSATEALALSEAVPASWLLFLAIARRRLDAVGIVSTLTLAIAFAAYALSGGDPVALKLRHGAVTGVLGIAALASVALDHPFLLRVAQHATQLDPERRTELAAKLAEPGRRAALTTLTLIIGITFTIDGATQTALAMIVPTSAFVADSTAAHIVVLGLGVAVTIRYLQTWNTRRPKPLG